MFSTKKSYVNRTEYPSNWIKLLKNIIEFVAEVNNFLNFLVEFLNLYNLMFKLLILNIKNF